MITLPTGLHFMVPMDVYHGDCCAGVGDDEKMGCLEREVIGECV